ncbi:hypothetical protein WN48_10716 [Eufriesea mexicana]|uniref:Uncharacterized protein n=1 Tax=Eufriesea mexicana TaxID=516756 RepID=A0A310S6P4_9HYME|nr:hypothetical protein WN48_10716 [Eufriesea mexicana]
MPLLPRRKICSRFRDFVSGEHDMTGGRSSSQFQEMTSFPRILGQYAYRLDKNFLANFATLY